jgi:hypothetical protein
MDDGCGAGDGGGGTGDGNSGGWHQCLMTKAVAGGGVVV